MYKFNAIVTNNRQIRIETNTYWSCKSVGNFSLSKYDGSGNTDIDIHIPDDEMIAEGTVYFSYGDDRCKYPEVSVFYTNNCLIRTTPSYVTCGENNQKTIFFYYNEKGEMFNVNILCISGWNAYSPTLKYFINNNGIMIVSNEEDGAVTIKPNGDCEEDNFIEIRLVKNPD